MSYVMEDAHPSRALGTSTPRECIEASGLVMARLLRVGDRLSGARIVERLVDEDGEIVLVLEDGSFVEFAREA